MTNSMIEPTQWSPKIQRSRSCNSTHYRCLFFATISCLFFCTAAAFLPQNLSFHHQSVAQLKRNAYRRRRIKEPVSIPFYTRRTSIITKNHESATQQSKTTTSAPTKNGAIQIVETFQPNAFNPAPFARNPHIQTVLGYLLKKQHPLFTYWRNDGDDVKDIMSLLFQNNNEGGKEEKEYGDQFWDERKRYETLDGDFFDVDFKYCSSPSKSRGLVIQTHGIESSSYSPVSIDMAKAFLDQDMDVACINFRGCSGEPNRTFRAYHLGFTDDLKQFITETSKTAEENQQVKRPIFLAGFSMGSNVILKLLGELGDNARNKNFNIVGAAISCAPFDFTKNKSYFEKNPLLRKFYTDSIVESLKQKSLTMVETKMLQNKCGNDDEGMMCVDNPPIDVDALRACEIQEEFEDAYVAPVFGFDDHLDYYDRTSCCNFVHSIKIPTLVVNAADDPFFCPDSIPDSEEIGVDGTPVKIVKTKHGGHLGYMFHQLETASKAQKHDEHLDRGQVAQFERQSKHIPAASWMSMELARFVDHVCINYQK